MANIKWVRPSGAEIETNDAPGTIAYAESQGWKKQTKATKSKRKTATDKSGNDGRTS